MKASNAGSAAAFGLGHPDLLQRALGLRVLALRQLVEDVGGLVHPAALLAGCRPHLAERLPEAERAVGDGKLRRQRQTAALQIEQQITPIVCALARAIGEADQLLPAFRRRADDDQDALRLVLEPGLADGCRRPRRRRSAWPTDRASATRVLVDPDLLQAGDGRGRQPGASLPSRAASASSKSPVEMPFR